MNRASYKPIGSHGEEAVNPELEHAQIVSGFSSGVVDLSFVLQRQVEQDDAVDGN